MMLMSLFPFAVAILDLGAVAIYLSYKQYALAITWLCYAIAAVSLGMVKND